MSYFCKKCGAKTSPTDKKCPNGHVLKETDRRIEVVVEEKIALSAKLAS